MAYPALPATYDSGETTADDIQPDRASNGDLRVRSFYVAPKRIFRVVHDGLTAAQKGTFDAYYLANRSATFAFTWPYDGVSYTVAFTKSPTRTLRPGGWWRIDVELGEV